MPAVTLTQKRAIAGILLVVLLVCAGSYYLDWELFGGADRKVLAVVAFICVVVATRWGYATLAEIREHQSNKKSDES